MPGTYVHDSTVTKLHNAVAISTATTTTGTGVKVGKPGLVRFKQSTGAITGTSATFDTEIQGSDDDGSTDAYVTLGKFDTLTESDDSETHYIVVQLYKKYVRAVTITTGTSPTAAVTVTMEERHFLQTTSDTA